jgi:hypothetical protein
MGGATIGAGGYIPPLLRDLGTGGGQVQNYIDVKQSAVKVCFSASSPILVHCLSYPI